MTRADSVHSTPPTNTSKTDDCLPPAVGIEDPGGYDPAARATAAGHPLAVLIRLRDEAARDVERLLAFLDVTDGADDLYDSDVEPNGDELDASYPEGGERLLSHPIEDDEDGNDTEPSLGMPEPVLTGMEHDWWWPYMSTNAAQHETQPEACDDLEEEHDGAEPDFENEPSLGWSVSGHHGKLHGLDMVDAEEDGDDLEPSLCGVTVERGDDRDLEDQCEDEGEIDLGIGDMDGLMEQDPARFAHCDVRVEA